MIFQAPGMQLDVSFFIDFQDMVDKQKAQEEPQKVPWFEA